MNIYFARWKLPAILWGGTILVLTSIPTISIPDLGFDLGDKFYHFAVYFVFGFLVNRAFVENKISRLHFLKNALIFAIVFSVFDEVHQIFIPGRYGEVLDWLADLLGILLAYPTFKILLLKILAQEK